MRKLHNNGSYQEGTLLAITKLPAKVFNQRDRIEINVILKSSDPKDNKIKLRKISKPLDAIF